MIDNTSSINQSRHEFTPMDPAPETEKENKVPVTTSNEVVNYTKTGGKLVIHEEEEKKRFHYSWFFIYAN